MQHTPGAEQEATPIGKQENEIKQKETLAQEPINMQIVEQGQLIEEQRKLQVVWHRPTPFSWILVAFDLYRDMLDKEEEWENDKRQLQK